jgi:hypothetical protein
VAGIEADLGKLAARLTRRALGAAFWKYHHNQGE